MTNFTHKEYDSPWKYLIVDNFFDKDVFDIIQKELSSHNTNIKKENTGAVDHSLHPQTFDYVHKRELYSFLKYFQDHRTLSDNWKYFWEVTHINGGYKYPLHWERENKVLSVVVYVEAEDGIGTILYDQNCKYVKEIDFVPNRALVFCGITDVTWHAYYNLIGKRITLNGFILNDV